MMKCRGSIQRDSYSDALRYRRFISSRGDCQILQRDPRGVEDRDLLRVLPSRLCACQDFTKLGVHPADEALAEGMLAFADFAGLWQVVHYDLRAWQQLGLQLLL